MKIQYKKAIIEGEQTIIRIPKDRLVNVSENWFDTEIQVRRGGNFEGKAFYLNDINFDWLVAEDDYGRLILIPIRKTPK